MIKSVFKPLCWSILYVIICMVIIYMPGITMPIILNSYESLLLIDEYYFNLVDTFIYLLLFAIFYCFTEARHYQFFSLQTNKSNYWVLILYMLILSVIYRIIEDPLLRFDLVNSTSIDIPISEEREVLFTERLIVFVNVVILIPIFEEFLFRQKMLGLYHQKYITLGILFSSVLFMVVHVNVYNVLWERLVTVFFFGILASIIYIRYSLQHSILFHSTYNLVWFFIDANSQKYWNMISYLNFDYRYWLIVLFAFMSMVILIYKILRNDWPSPKGSVNDVSHGM